MTCNVKPAPIRRDALPARAGAPEIVWAKFWASFGVVWLAMVAYSVGRWFFGGYAHPVASGPDPVPTYSKVAIWAWHGIFVVICALAIYHIIYKPWRREGRLSTDGMLVIAFTSLWSQDPLLNYSQAYLTWNSYSPNLGCPQCFMPGWQSRHVFLPEGFLNLAFYLGMAIFAVILGCRAMGWMQNRWPRSPLRPLIVLFIGAFVFDISTELVWMLPGIYSYLGASSGPGPVLFAGKYNQLPLVELVFAALWYVAFVAMRFYRNDKGQTFAERGLEQVAKTRQRSLVRLFALIGGANAVMLVAYTIPMDFISRHWNSVPPDVYNRSYLVQNNCGPLSQYACADSGLPMLINPANLYVRPDGTVVPPKDGFPTQTRG